MRIKTFLLAGTVAVASIGAATAANANPISIGLSQTAGPGGITTVATGDGSATFAGSFGTFDSNFISVMGTPPLAEPTLATASIAVNSTTPGSQTLYIYVTEQNLTSLNGVSNLVSGFTSNLFTGAVQSVDEYSFVDPSNGLWGGSQLASTTFTSAPASNSVIAATADISGPFSETAQFIIRLNDVGSVNDTITIATPVPEPTAIALLGMAFVGFGMMRRHKHSLG